MAENIKIEIKSLCKMCEVSQLINIKNTSLPPPEIIGVIGVLNQVPFIGHNISPKPPLCITEEFY